mgnify:CR=1 FL=1|tara:strand:+ start:562 stop:1107 length:546 start_codon:yes stop_codon:yes gene_type:complete
MTLFNQTFTPVQLFTGIIYSPTIQLKQLLSIVEESFNQSILLTSLPIDFSHSSYYEHEMGPNLKRIFVGFNALIAPQQGYTYKLKAVQTEERHKINGNRKFNLDPGIISMHNLILYSTKNFSHRMACNSGIYAEVTCLFKRKSLSYLEWTYPDFKVQAHQHFFLNLRSGYKNKLRRLNYEF